MKILGTLTVDTPNALDKVTDLNADLLDGKSSEQYLSRGLGDFNYEANYERTGVDDNTIDTSIILGRDTQLSSINTKVANSSLILKTGGLTNGTVSSNPSTLTLYKNGDSPSGNTIILGSAGIVNTSGALILNNNSSGDFLIKQGATNEVRLRIAEKVTYLGNFTNTSIGGSTATYVDKFDTALVVGTPTTAATSPAVFIGRFNRTVGENTNSEASVAGIDYKGNVLTGLSIIGKSIVFRTDDTGDVSDTTISDRMVISSTGLIGIGLANPTTMLQIKPNTNIDLIKFTDAAGTKTLFHVDSVGRIGINTVSNATAQLYITGTSAAVGDNTRFGIYNDLIHNIAAPTSAIYGSQIKVTANFTSTTTLNAAYGLYVAPITVTGTGAGTLYAKYGIYQAGANDTNVFMGATTFSNAFTVSCVSSAINIGYLQTNGVLTLGGTLQTGIITLGRSTVTHTLNIDAGATTTGNTKTINIGTGGVTDSTTTITYGSSIGTTHTFNGSVDISGSLTVRNPAVYASSTSGVTQIVLGDSGSKTVVLEREKASYNTAATKIYSENGYNVPSLGASFYTEYVKLYTLGIERMRINAAGNLLIGKTTDDGNKLQVEGSASVSGNLTVTKNTTELVYNQAGLSINTTDLSSPILAFHRAGISATALYETDGELYVNAWVSKPQTGKLISSGNYNSYSTFTGTISNPAVSFSGTALPNSLVVDSAGKVGINTPIPTEKLHVVGNILATGTVSGSNIFTQYHWSFTIATANTSGCTIRSNTYNTTLCSNSAFYKRTALNTSLGTTSDVDFSSYLICVYIMAGIGNWEIVYPDIVIESGGVIAITFASDQHGNNFKVVMV
jgi:hypothetical protein